MITIPHAVADHDLVGEGLYRHHREGDNSAVGGVNCATNNSLSSMTDHLGRRPIYVAEPSRQCFHDLPNSVSAVSRIGDRYRELLTLSHRARRQLPANTARRRSIGRCRSDRRGSHVGRRGSATLHRYGVIAARAGESMITIPHAVADHDLVGEGLYRHHREGDNSAVGGVNCATNNSLSSMTDHLGRRPIYVAEPSRQCFHDLPNSSVSAVSRIGDRYRELLTLSHRARRQLPARTGLLREHRTQAQQSYNAGDDQQQRKRFSDQTLSPFSSVCLARSSGALSPRQEPLRQTESLHF